MTEKYDQKVWCIYKVSHQTHSVIWHMNDPNAELIEDGLKGYQALMKSRIMNSNTDTYFSWYRYCLTEDFINSRQSQIDLFTLLEVEE